MNERAKPWLVKYDGTCSRCGTVRHRGEPTSWDRASHTMRCTQCPDDSELTVDHGSAGGSAHREYERRMAKRDAAAREKWGRQLGGMVLALTDAPTSTRAWSI